MSSDTGLGQNFQRLNYSGDVVFAILARTDPYLSDGMGTSGQCIENGIGKKIKKKENGIGRYTHFCAKTSEISAHEGVF